MFLKKLFRPSPNYEENLTQLSKEIKKLRKEIKKISEENKQSILMETVNIEKLIIERYETNNHLGQLGIKELHGKLYIGATYGENSERKQTPFPKEETNEMMKKEGRSKKENERSGPKINIR
ncbi:hypothetical protein [Falsibacillus pallidus]|uniref:hypothetical protein n=1 Tax=Falsibacillus pallidus TaxID=493781 RepID=UPI003D984036